mmetsp:Transcript_132826/g.283826  ORF Transcript_132826/g.283826 Transcript_132826/m.283826 type:complete len:246 (-) Transcript_132826:438-1175(-)
MQGLRVEQQAEVLPCLPWVAHLGQRGAHSRGRLHLLQAHRGGYQSCGGAANDGTAGAGGATGGGAVGSPCALQWQVRDHCEADAVCSLRGRLLPEFRLVHTGQVDIRSCSRPHGAEYLDEGRICCQRRTPAEPAACQPHRRAHLHQGLRRAAPWGVQEGGEHLGRGVLGGPQGPCGQGDVVQVHGGRSLLGLHRRGLLAMGRHLRIAGLDHRLLVFLLHRAFPLEGVAEAGKVPDGGGREAGVRG